MVYDVIKGEICMVSYEFIHLRFLAQRVTRGDRITNEDYIFLTELRGELKNASTLMETIDNAIEASLENV